MKICLSVTNDIVTDQRVTRIAASLLKLNAVVTVIGRKKSTCPEMEPSGFKIKRFRLLFNKGPLFYACYNIRLFFYLLLHRFDLLVANDLDTLPANYFIAKLKRVKLVYDSHEYFTEVPELVGRENIRKIWKMIESRILPNIRYSYTVCDSIAQIYNAKYQIDMQVFKNLPLRSVTHSISEKLYNGKENIILYQGSVNKARGLETVIAAMKYLNNAKFVIIGDGDIKTQLEELVIETGVAERVIFKGRITPGQLSALTRQAHLGISLEENTGLNYYYALPNKLFDYIQASVPVLVSDFPEMGSLVRKYNIGEVTLERDPKKLAKLIQNMLSDSVRLRVWKENLEKAARILVWENEEDKLLDFYRKII